jgi:pyruvate dehydrogenase E2 component (dihydrolipoamide acetyltransferase)
LWVYQVEDPDDIQNVPATVADGSEVREEKSTTTDNVLEKNSVKTVTSELPPHVVLDMPALSPTMVRKIVYLFLLRLLC